MTPEETLRGVAGLGGAIGDAVDSALIELEELRAMKRRAEECSTWCGVDGMHRAVRYIQTGEAR